MGIKNTMTPVVFKSAKSADLLVAGRAWMLVIYGKTAIIKKFPAEFKTFFAERVIIKIIMWGRKTIRHFLAKKLKTFCRLVFFTRTKKP